ncbi:MAG TPA: Tat pathway signal protein, partial [Burkholderiaceae bacterium]|nr:Tat pathway signal protein [Burkholderiaceae bacterium]
MTTQASRREFLRTASRLSVAGVATPWAVNLAAIGAAAAQTAPTDYKALVCVFMYGGNDHSNMVVPFDNVSYTLYAQSRTNLTLAQTSLLPLATPTNPSMAGRQVSLRSELQPLKSI